MKGTGEPELFLYGKAGCSPCDHFKAALDELGISYHPIGIDTDPELQQRYGARVPVLVAGNTEVCEGRFDDAAVLEYLKKQHGAGARQTNK